MTALDDLKMIHDRDAQDALGVAEKQWEQLLINYEVDLSSIDAPAISNIVVGGMGGSALAAQYIQAWPTVTKPFQIVRDYYVPDYVGPGTLFVASSYSGNTEETLSALAVADQAGAQVVVIAAGGELEKWASSNNRPFYKIPEGFQPRMAVLYNLAALINMVDSLRLSKNQNITQQLHDAAQWLKDQTAKFRPDLPTTDNQAKQLALEMMGSSPVVYSSTLFYPVAYKWKISFNENAKNVAWCGTYPEFNHNEFLGWTSHPVDKPYKVVDLRSNLDEPQTMRRFEISDRLLSGKRPAAHVVNLEGQTLLHQLLWGTALGDFVSLYTALLNGLNPTPVDLITKLKQELA